MSISATESEECRYEIHPEEATVVKKSIGACRRRRHPQSTMWVTGGDLAHVEKSLRKGSPSKDSVVEGPEPTKLAQDMASIQRNQNKLIVTRKTGWILKAKRSFK
ncbi:MAG: hypothetical protein IPK04_12980 [Bdellovibrionales bacterium]|nr:hypothetical protein [Bdellovibrionales bacterium]